MKHSFCWNECFTPLKIIIVGQGQRMQEVPVVATGVTRRRGPWSPAGAMINSIWRRPTSLSFFTFHFSLQWLMLVGARRSSWNWVRIASSMWKLLTFFEIQYGGRRHLGSLKFCIFGPRDRYWFVLGTCCYYMVRIASSKRKIMTFSKSNMAVAAVLDFGIFAFLPPEIVKG